MKNLTALLMICLCVPALAGKPHHTPVRLGERNPGDEVEAVAKPPGRVTNGRIVDNDRWPWKKTDNPARFTATVPDKFDRKHHSRFAGLYYPWGKGPNEVGHGKIAHKERWTIPLSSPL